MSNELYVSNMPIHADNVKDHFFYEHFEQLEDTTHFGILAHCKAWYNNIK